MPGLQAEAQYFGYDEGGNLVAMKDNWGASYFAFDELNRLTRRSTPRGDATYFGYDPVSNLLRLQFPQDGKSAYFGYDGAQRMKEVLSPSDKAAYYAFDSSSNV